MDVCRGREDSTRHSRRRFHAPEGPVGIRCAQVPVAVCALRSCPQNLFGVEIGSIVHQFVSRIVPLHVVRHQDQLFSGLVVQLLGHPSAGIREREGTICRAAGLSSQRADNHREAYGQDEGPFGSSSLLPQIMQSSSGKHIHRDCCRRSIIWHCVEHIVQWQCLSKGYSEDHDAHLSLLDDQQQAK